MPNTHARRARSYLYHNQLTGTLPSVIGGLPNLGAMCVLSLLAECGRTRSFKPC